jgi:Gpi18-like mannosyltransferase
VILWTVGMFTFIAAYAARQNGGDIFSAVDGFKLGGTDVPHYSNIAENWYRNDGTDNRFMIVFFPLFPLLLKIAKSAVQSYVWSALLINAVLAVFSGIGFYKLSGLVLKKRNVNRAVKMLYIFPAAFFFYIPMTEALFMACTVYFFLFLVKRKYLWVFVFGFLAALTRIQGILLLVPFIAEIIREFLPSEDRQEAKPGVIKILAGFGAPLGFGVYLMINFMVYGDAFQYMAYQREHWYQSASYFWNTVSYLQNYGAGYLQEKSYGYFLSLSLPALVTAFGSLTLLLIGAKKRLRLSLMMYAVVYFVVSYAPTWLLSGPRYMMCCFPLAMIAGTALDGHKRAERVLSVFYLAAYFLYLHMFLTRYPVY